MYPKIFSTLTGLWITFLSACTSAHAAGRSSAANLQVSNINTKDSSLPNKKNVFIGPPEYIPPAPVTKKPVDNKIIEKGGTYTYIPPAYTMARPEKGTDKYSVETLHQKIKKIKKFAADNNYDTTVAFFIDMEVKSGKDRFLVVNMANDSIIKK